ncbi:hypothetical protein CAR_c11930 [Carnobacterium sp. 17-4]|uniref:hypothetical protein n=1 Tax=Carnobacterium sp. (strain 17-4) TaxID=208596 RepID=UPI00020584F4|nr:hypothetical protein [Carnobacterium sp. 17-4]AEB29885.1 hypothetical protein CAR_c11930 [Carnobacterium sp. 17-4]
MKNKIYNKKTFWLGIFFLLLSLVSVRELIFFFDSMSGGEIVKVLMHLVFDTFVGFWLVQESLSYKQAKRAEQEKDEREELVNLKSANASIIIIQIASFILVIVAVIVWYLGRINGLIGAALIGSAVAFGIVFILTFFSQLVTYLYYYNKI